MTRGDLLVVGVVALVAALAWPATYLAASGNADTVIISGPHGVSDISLHANRTVAVDGLSGTVRIRTENGSVRVTESSCRDKICIHQGSLSHPGGALVCAPNGVTVRIGGDGNGLDSVVR